MIRTRVGVAVLGLLLAAGGWIGVRAAEKPADDPVVYATRTGKKYHKSACSYLAKSKIAIKLSEAVKKGLTPCSKCGGK